MIENKLINKNASLLLVTSIGLACLYLVVRKNNKKKDGFKDIPSVSSIRWPIVGHLLSMGSSPFKQIDEWYKKTGPIFKLDVGNQPWVVVCDSDMAYKLLVLSANTTSSRPYHRFLTETFSKKNRGLIFSEQGDTFKNNRKIIINLLKPNSIDRYAEVTNFEADELVNRLSKAAEKGEAINPVHDLKLASTNIVFHVAFGRRIDSVDDPLYKDVINITYESVLFGGATGDLGTFFPLLSYLNGPLGLDKAAEDWNKKRDKVYKRLINDAIQSDGPSLAKDLLKEMNAKMISEEDHICLLNDLTNAGLETTANAIHWAMSILSQNLECQAKLAKEFDDWKLKNPSRDVPNFHQDRESFQYSICVQKEILRLRPPAPIGMQHYCTEDTVVDEYMIPKGTTLIYYLNSAQRNPKIYPDPDVFKPERFIGRTEKMSDSSNANNAERDHFAFGWGRRKCPGIYLAELELFNFYVRFFSKYTVEPELDSNGKPKILNSMEYVEEGLASAPAHPFVRIVPRQKQK
ncbi:cytochrome P450 [Sporodiniella umbellata]|nr:cytochrome P450 [Sporodiniella umbellata]